MKKPKLKNKFETEVYNVLKRKKLNVKYESAKLTYLIAGHYIPDFVITTPSNSIIYLETKGYFRPESKRKLVAVRKLHPAADIRLVFYAHRDKDIKWAEKNGFKWCIGIIPEEWFHEFKH